MATTTNFGWETPDDTDLVKDGALAMRTLGNSIDSSFVDLKGGTTGQVLAKASNTDLDYTWVTQDDANAIQNAIVDAKGDLIAASAADTPARLAVGNNGETLVADSSASTGLRWQGNFAAGKNKIINGDFAINQRGFTSTTTTGTYGFDRFNARMTDGTVTYSAQTFTLGSAPVAGYESTNFARINVTGQTLASARADLTQPIEDVRTLAGQTVTVSFWAKAASGTPKVAVELGQNFSGGSSFNPKYFGQVTLSTSWQRYSVTAALDSLSGKTIGTNANSLTLVLFVSAGSDLNARTGSLGIQNNTFDFWGIQVEAGNVATAFQTATGTLAGELAACQRYYFRATASNSYTPFGVGAAYANTAAQVVLNHPVAMRIGPSSFDFGNLAVIQAGAGTTVPTTITLTNTGPLTSMLNCTGATGLTAGNATILLANNTNAAYIALNAEL